MLLIFCAPKEFIKLHEKLNSIILPSFNSKFHKYVLKKKTYIKIFVPVGYEPV